MMRGFPLFLAPFALFVAFVGCDAVVGLNVGPGKLDLGITKTTSADSVAVGSPVTFTVTVTNHGPIPADTVTAGDTLPTGLTYSSHTTTAGTVYTPATGRWAIGTMAVGATRTLNLTATVAANAGTLLWNRAAVLAFQQDTALQSNPDSLRNNADSVSVRAIAPPGANLLVFTTQPTNTSAGASFGVVVTARTPQGATITNFTGTVTLAIGTNPGSGTLSGTTSVSAVAGVATFTGLSINNVGTGYTLTANATGLTGATSASFNITSAGATQLAFTTPPLTVAAGGSFGVVVAARNAGGSTVTSYTGTVSLAIGTNPGGGTLSGTTSVAAVAGVATFTGLSINNVGTGYTLTASATSLTSATSAPFNIVTSSSAEPVDPGVGYLWAENMDRYASIVAMTSPGNCPGGSDGFGVPSAQGTYGRRTEPSTVDATAACSSRPSIYNLVTGRGGIGQAGRIRVLSDPTDTQSNGGRGWITPWGNSSALSYAAGQELVTQAWFRFSGGAGTFTSSGGAKWWEMWYNGPNSRIEVSTHVNNRWHVNAGFTGNEIGYQPVGPYPADFQNDNIWHKWTVAYKPNTTYNYPSASSRDGYIRVWVDGTKIIDISAATVGVTPTGGTKVWCTNGDLDQIPNYQISFLWVLPAYVNGSTAAFDLDFDDLKIWVP